MAFWQQFGPTLQGYAATLGNDDFFMFGEVFDANPAFMSRYTTEGRLQATVDFGFQASATAYAKGEQTPVVGVEAGAVLRERRLVHRHRLQRLLAADLPRQPRHGPDREVPRGHRGDGRTLLQRDQFAHALMYTTRGQPVIYYGDEQGFTGDGGDQDARQDMFASQVADLQRRRPDRHDARRRPGPTTTAVTRSTATSATWPTSGPTTPRSPTARRSPGTRPTVRASTPSAGSRREERRVRRGREQLGPGQAPRRSRPTRRARPSRRSGRPGARRRAGTRQPRGAQSGADKQVTVSVPALSVVVYRATKGPASRPARARAGHRLARRREPVEGRAPVAVDLPRDDFSQATVSWRPVGGDDLDPARHRRQRALPRVPRRQRVWPRGRSWSTASW